jgi:hypothetical protein
MITTFALAATVLAIPLASPAPQESAASFTFTSWSCDSCGTNNICLSFGHQAVQGECYPLEQGQVSLKVLQSITPRCVCKFNTKRIRRQEGGKGKD